MHTKNAPVTAGFPAMPKNGYTIVEIVVMLTMFSVLVGSIFTGLYGARRAGAVHKAADQFAANLREAALMTQSGVLADGCEASPATPCTRYKVTFAANSDTYTRMTHQGTNAVQFRLPPGAVFVTAGEVRFAYNPPLLTSEGGQVVFRIQHASSSTIFSDVCVSVLGAVYVGGC